MSSSSNPVITTIDVFRVAPSFNSPHSPSQLSLPLTSYDIPWVKSQPAESIFFFKLTEPTPTFFNSVVLPQLKHSLSLTIPRFLPVAGDLTWPPHSSVPTILYTPKDGAVSVTVAESNADFHRLSAHGATRPVAESHPYIPDLEISESKASVLSVQITNFPNQGFCIGFSSHHAVIDAKSILMFIKTWAQTCKQGRSGAPGLTAAIPSYDRTVIAAHGDTAAALDLLKKMDPSSTPRSLRLLPAEPPQEDLTIGAAHLSREQIARLKENISTRMLSVGEDRRPVSSFAAVLAYTLLSWLKAKQQARKPALVVFPADFRGRLNPPLPPNYFGNCLEPCFCEISKEDQEEMEVHDRWVASIANKISDAVRGLDQFDKEAAARKLFGEHGVDRHVIGVSGSTRLQFYDTDFGWGKPVKVEITSIAKTGAISLAESGDGGAEVGLSLSKHEMEAFQDFFATGLKFPV